MLPSGFFAQTNENSRGSITFPHGGPTSDGVNFRGSPGNVGLPATPQFLNSKAQTPGFMSNSTSTYAYSYREPIDPRETKNNIRAGRFAFVRSSKKDYVLDPLRVDMFSAPAMNAYLSSPEGIRLYGNKNYCSWFEEDFNRVGVIQHDAAKEDSVGEQSVITVITNGRARMPLVWAACGRQIHPGAKLFYVLRKVKTQEQLSQLMGPDWNQGSSQPSVVYWRLEPWFSNPGDMFSSPPLDAYRGVIDGKQWIGKEIRVGVAREFFGAISQFTKTSDSAYAACFPGMGGLSDMTDKEDSLHESGVVLH